MNTADKHFFKFAFLLRCLPALLTLLLGIWCSSGTLAIYALTLKGAQVSEPCKYLLNIDNAHFLGTYLLLDGFPRSVWEWSVVLRRMLYPLFAYPFMKQWGFEIGGFIANLALYAGTFVLFVSYVRRRYHEKAAIAAAWILATYPGVNYWAGLPYSYVAIVPMSLLAGACVVELEHAASLRRIFLLSLLMGIAFTGYDLLPFFAPAALLVLLMHRKWMALPVCIAAMLAPSLLMTTWLKSSYAVDFTNSNTVTYKTIITAYLNPPPFSAWWPIIAEVPKIALHNFFSSGFFFLPLLFLCFLGLKALKWKLLPAPSRAELAMLASVALLFLFSNLAPPYAGWQLRGMWIARLYQPIFVPFLLYSIRVYSKLEGDRAIHLGTVLLGLAIVLNAAVVFGPITNWALAEPVYYNFYRHSPRGTMTENIMKYGQRPLGFCDEKSAPASNPTSAR